jgi:hypothetical protein
LRAGQRPHPLLLKPDEWSKQVQVAQDAYQKAIAAKPKAAQ